MSTVLITKGIEAGEVYVDKYLVRPFLWQKSHHKNASKLNVKNLVKNSRMLLKLWRMVHEYKQENIVHAEVHSNE